MRRSMWACLPAGRWLLDLLKNHPDDDALQDKDVQNNIGTIFEDGIMVKKDINKAVYWYELAISQGDDLAMSNLADILRKGSQACLPAGRAIPRT